MPGAAPRPATLRSAFAIAWPASLAAVVTPLLGLIDVAVLARGADAQALAGAALAGAVFSLLYWSFGFLRMGLSGLTAQAHGAGDEATLRAQLAQGCGLGFAIGVLILLASPLIASLAQSFMVDSSEASAGAGEAMQTYLGIRIWGAPSVFTTTALLGWFTGQGRTGLLMATTIGIAAINAVLSVLFVLGMDLGIGGLAAATLIAEVCGLLIALAGAAWVLHQRGGLRLAWSREKLRQGWKALLSLNADIFIRTLVLDAVFLSFARFGAEFGDLTLAANHVLLNLVLTVTLLLDGPAIAAETFVGQAVGAEANRKALFRKAWRETAKVAGWMAAAILLAMLFAGEALLALTVGDGPDTAAVLSEATRFLPWAAVMPLAVAIAYHLDGVFIGATRGAAMRNTMAFSGLVYFALAFALIPAFGNHGLWLALLLFMLLRGLSQIAVWRGFAPILAKGSRG